MLYTSLLASQHVWTEPSSLPCSAVTQNELNLHTLSNWHCGAMLSIVLRQVIASILHVVDVGATSSNLSSAIVYVCIKDTGYIDKAILFWRIGISRNVDCLSPVGSQPFGYRFSDIAGDIAGNLLNLRRPIYILRS